MSYIGKVGNVVNIVTLFVSVKLTHIRAKYSYHCYTDNLTQHWQSHTVTEENQEQHVSTHMVKYHIATLLK